MLQLASLALCAIRMISMLASYTTSRNGLKARASKDEQLLQRCAFTFATSIHVTISFDDSCKHVGRAWLNELLHIVLVYGNWDIVRSPTYWF